VGDGHELVQGWPANDVIEVEVDLRDVEDDALHAVVLKRPECDREGDVTTQNDGARPTLKNGRERESLDMGIYSF
jgi:hypothetical protein